MAQQNPNSRPWFIIPNDVPNVVEESQDSYWPNLVASIDNNEIQFKDLEVECESCKDLVTIYNRDHVIDEEIGESHRGVILPCGHIFGASCIKYFFNMKEEENAEAFCPKCRAACVHPFGDCRHAFYGKSIPTHKPGIDSIPHILSKGGRIAQGCRACSIQFAIEDICKKLEEWQDLPACFAVCLEVDREKHWSHQVEEADIQEVVFPSHMLDFIAEYKEIIEHIEDSPVVWMNDYISHCQFKLYVHASAETKPYSADEDD
ncbi:hypothetical protein IL306_002383 [Fusarium sp. DS 682]|nr:hypothetical protein IL306_002383 [Fusarium sp. DS 682]